jgi:hypothetical protein
MKWKTCFSTLAKEWGAELGQSGTHEALRRSSAVTRHGTKGVVVFPGVDVAPVTPATLFEICEKLNQGVPTLALVCDPAHFQASPRAGSRVLFCPDYPEVALAALQSASWVVSFDPYVTQLCSELGIHCYSNSSARSEWALPWKDSVDATARLWAENLVSVSAPAAIENMPQGTAAYGVCAVADSNFISFFFGLVENLLRVTEQPFHIFLLALDERAKELAQKQYPKLPMTVFLASDVWPEADWKEYQHKPIAERAYASKPRAVLEGLRRMQGAPLFFADVDIHFFESPYQLASEFKNDNILFMPQWSDVFAWARFHGMFNSGLMAVKQGAEPFLQWWADMCVPFCRVEMEKGYFTDQVFLDMGLWHFPKIGIYRAMDQNVAPWNRKTLGVYRAGQASGTLRLKDHRPVKSFHAAGPDSDGYFQLKFAWDQMVSFFSVIEDSDQLNPLFRNTVDQQRLHWPELDNAIEVRARWNHRLRRRTPALTAEYVNHLLTPSEKSRTAWLTKIERLGRSFVSLFRRQPSTDNISKEEQRQLICIQQRFAFAGVSDESKAVSR